MKKTKIVIDRFEGDYAVVSLDGKSWNIPRAVLPDDAAEGDVLYLSLSTSDQEKASQEELARAVLNEVLKES